MGLEMDRMTRRLFGVVKGHREHVADHTGRLYSDSEVADLLNTVYEENEKLKSDNEWLIKCIGDQSAIIHELDNTIMAYNMEHKITIKLTEKDLKTLDKALSYYTHQKVEE